jgi:hypothetical protein
MTAWHYFLRRNRFDYIPLFRQTCLAELGEEKENYHAGDNVQVHKLPV